MTPIPRNTDGRQAILAMLGKRAMTIQQMSVASGAAPRSVERWIKEWIADGVNIMKTPRKKGEESHYRRVPE